MKRLLIVLALCVSAGVAHADLATDAPGAVPLTPQQQARYQSLLAELRCLVCQNQTLLESDAPLAADLRKKVRKQIVAGRSNAQIKHYLTSRYGDFVLYRPPFMPETWLLWVGPFVLLAIAGFSALVYIRRRRPAPPANDIDADALQRLLEDEK